MKQFREKKEQEEFIAVGKVTTFQGNLGEVRVLPLTDFPEQFSPGSRFWVTMEDTIKVLEVESVRRHKRFIVVKFAGVECIDDAEALRGAVLQVPRTELVRLPHGHYYAFEIEGLQVVTTEGRYLGKVERVISGLANDIYEVARDQGECDGQEKILIPAARDIVKDIDLESGTMIVELIPGLE